MNIPLSQKKILIVSFAALAVFFVFYFFIYLPSSKTALRIESEINLLEEQAREAEGIMGRVKTTEAGRRLLDERLQILKNKFSSKVEEALKMVPELAKRVNIEVTTFNSVPKKPYLDENNNKVEILGKPCQVVSVHMEGKCFYYKSLVKYLELLNKNLPGFEVVQKLKVTRSKPGMPQLNITLDLNLYFLI
jgi:hypothetical protein